MRYLIAAALLALPGCEGGGIGHVGPVGNREWSGSMRTGVEHLLRSQNKDGSWGDAKGATGFETWLPATEEAHQALRTTTTALCVLALRMAAFNDQNAMKAHARGLEYLLKAPDIRTRLDGRNIYNIWAHVYALQTFAQEFSVTRDERMMEATKRHARAVLQYETIYGGWTYHDDFATKTPSSAPLVCVTAVSVIACERARSVVPDQTVKRALAVLQQCRNPDGTYLHGPHDAFDGRRTTECGAGGLARRQAANYALMKNLLLTEEECRGGLDALFAGAPQMRHARKRPVPHDGFFDMSGGYYYFAYYYAARIISELPPLDRAIYVPKLLDAVVRWQERDGSWWDQPLYGYHKAYGTALAVLALALCQ